VLKHTGRKASVGLGDGSQAIARQAEDPGRLQGPVAHQIPPLRQEHGGETRYIARMEGAEEFFIAAGGVSDPSNHPLRDQHAITAGPPR